MDPSTIPFEPFPKIPRLERSVLVTEKLDGTNAQVFITEDGDVLAGSRKRWITPGKNTDNFGFAAWVEDNREELLKLGPGQHFGEWWGQGIQRRYGLEERRFSLFNVSRWASYEDRPSCCNVVPPLAHANFGDLDLDAVMAMLAQHGSFAAPGFMNPEGVVVYHSASRTMFKRTFEHDAEGKPE